jgi:hypothetical protein
MTPEEQANGALGLIWLLAKGGIGMERSGDKLRLTGMGGSPKEELLVLINPYKEAVLGYLDRLLLNPGVRRDIEEAAKDVDLL